jgi:nucleoside-diphosphate-sugar epimerase
MRVFVIGASGYIGGAVVRELLAHGHAVTGLVRSDASAAVVAGWGARTLRGDLSTLDALREGAATHDATVQAGFFRGPAFPDTERRALDALFAAMAGPHALAYTSGSWVYGDRGDALVDEDAPVAPIALVAWRPVHDALVLAAAELGIRPIVVRPTVVYGDGRGQLGAMMDQARSGVVRIVGDGRNRWPCVRVDALAQLYRLALENPNARGIYNAQTGAAVPYVELARAASRAGGGDGTIEHLAPAAARSELGPYADAVVLDLQVSVDKARRELGWTPQVPTALEELANTVVP